MKKTTLLLATVIIILSVHAQTNTQPGCYPFPKTISVTGSASMEIIPDEIYVQVDLREYKKKGEDKTELEKIKTGFLANCRSVGIADNDISVASYDGYNLANIWQRRKKDPELLASISYQVKFNNTKLIDDLVNKLDDQATNNFRITRTSHSKIVDYRKQLKVQAVKAAREKAVYLTEAVNEQLGQAIEINEPEESISSDVVSSAYRDRYKAVTENVVRLDQGKNAYYGVTDDGVDYRKLKLRFEVKVLYALK
ncbi:MAG TPA: SIMPL domain-containing protein [Ferruginibacter sp.]|nr:SIMPL domain-containing protein [Ferruginibacter sp.]